MMNLFPNLLLCSVSQPPIYKNGGQAVTPAESCRQDEKSTEIFVRAGRITGLSKVYGAQGNALAAKQADEKLTKTWIGGRSLLQLWKL
jgi:hypothetical protein